MLGRNASLSEVSGDNFTPLLGATSITGAPASRVQLCAQRLNNLALWKKLAIGFVVVLCVIVGSSVTYLGAHSAFKHVDRTVKFENGSAVEPNTQMRFPVELHKALDGFVRRFRLYCLFLQARHVPEIESTLRVFVLACWADVEAGRRELKWLRGKPLPDRKSPAFAKIIDTLASGRVSTTCEYRMMMSPPGMHMHDAWLGKLVLWWQHRNLSAERVQALSDAFSERFLHFRNHDDFTWEFAASGPRTNKGQTYVTFNEKKFKPVDDPEFGAAVTAHERTFTRRVCVIKVEALTPRMRFTALENGPLVLNLLPDFFSDDTS